MPQGVFSHAHDLLDGPRTPRTGLHRRIVGHDAHRPALDPRNTRDNAVGRQVGCHRVGEQAVLDERARVDEQCNAIADEQLVLTSQFGALLGQVAGERSLGSPFVRVDIGVA